MHVQDRPGQAMWEHMMSARARAHLLGGQVAHIELLGLHYAWYAPCDIHAQLFQYLHLPGVVCLQWQHSMSLSLLFRSSLCEYAARL